MAKPSKVRSGSEMGINALLNFVDVQYKKHRALKTSRFSPEWSRVSAITNRSARKRLKLENLNPVEKSAWMGVISYTMMMGQLLEDFHKRPYYGQSERKKKARELKNLRRLIVTGKPPEREFKDFQSFVTGMVK